MVFNTIYSALYNEFANMGNLGKYHSVVEHPKELKDKNALLILHGGADISPSLYGANCSSYTGANDRPSHRDRIEKDLLLSAVDLGITVLGICRGAQLACAIAGGKLVQHVTNHTSGYHTIKLHDGRVIRTNSVHHQMMYPFDIEHKMLGWSEHSLSSVYFGENDEPMEVAIEPEIVHFPQIKTLAVQGHPEWMPKESDLVKYIQNYFRN